MNKYKLKKNKIFFCLVIVVLALGIFANVTFSQSIDLDPTVIPELPSDSDGDGINDNFEDLFGMNKNDPNDINGDLDGDGLTNLEEYRLGTNLNNPDTDGDGITDDVEEARGFNPLMVPDPQLGENCIITALNRTSQVKGVKSLLDYISNPSEINSQNWPLNPASRWSSPHPLKKPCPNPPSPLLIK